MDGTRAQGWYPNEAQPGWQRFWDGDAWTEQRRDPAAPGPSAVGAFQWALGLACVALLCVVVGGLAILSGDAPERMIADLRTVVGLLLVPALALGLLGAVRLARTLSATQHALAQLVGGTAAVASAPGGAPTPDGHSRVM